MSKTQLDWQKSTLLIMYIFHYVENEKYQQNEINHIFHKEPQLFSTEAMNLSRSHLIRIHFSIYWPISLTFCGMLMQIVYLRILNISRMNDFININFKEWQVDVMKSKSYRYLFWI